ncbi:hypothetical protein ES705_31431 [subsurface metagenome]
MKKGNPNKCWYCGQEEKCTKEHFYPKSMGGSIIIYACRICQAAKGDLMPNKFVEYIEQHDLIREEKKQRIRTSVYSLMDHTRDQYLKIKTKEHDDNFGKLLIK